MTHGIKCDLFCLKETFLHAKKAPLSTNQIHPTTTSAPNHATCATMRTINKLHRSTLELQAGQLKVHSACLRREQTLRLQGHHLLIGRVHEE